MRPKLTATWWALVISHLSYFLHCNVICLSHSLEIAKVSTQWKVMLASHLQFCNEFFIGLLFSLIAHLFVNFLTCSASSSYLSMHSKNIQICQFETCRWHTIQASETCSLSQEQFLEAVWARIDAADKLVDETVKGVHSLEDLIQFLHASRFWPDEANDYIDANQHWIKVHQAKTRAIPSPSQPCTPVTNIEQSRHPSGPD